MGAHFMVGMPVVSGGLAVFPIGLDDDPRDVPRVLTLPEALDAGLAVMHETGRVQQLALEVLGDIPVFCMLGDVAVGGRQDRVLQADAVVMRGTGRVQVPAYCVERGRWERRGAESEVRFGSSTRAAPSSLRRLLVRGTHSQEEVWTKVRELQRTLSWVSTAGASVRDDRSRTSLALSLDHPELGRDLQELVEPLMVLPDEDVVGHALVIGGRLSHAELFGSADLHGRVFRQLMESAAVDALGQPMRSALPDPNEVSRWLEEALELRAGSTSPAGAAWTSTWRSWTATVAETVWAEYSGPLHVLAAAC